MPVGTGHGHHSSAADSLRGPVNGVLWGWLQVEIPRAEEGTNVRATMGAVGLSEQDARAGVQRVLDAWPHLANLASLWRAGTTTDDVFHYLTYWAVYSYDAQLDPRAGATSWLQQFLRERAAPYGLNLHADPIVVVAGPPERINDEALIAMKERGS